MDSRLPAHIEISGLIRLAQQAGGFATVLRKGERDAGTILILTMEKGENARLHERMPQIEGPRSFIVTRIQDSENKAEFEQYLRRRIAQDADSWLIELDVPNGERFIASLSH